MYNILVCDDEEKIRELIKKYGVFQGHTVLEAENGMEAVELCRKNHVDIVVMDVMMPELDGFSAVAQLRKESQVPVIMLSARGEEYDKIHGFSLGIDDYVVKPFSPKELLMRIDAVMKRCDLTVREQSHRQLVEGGLEIDFTARRVTVNGQETALSPKEMDLLLYLAENRGIALTREKLLTQVWGYDFYGDERTLDTHIKLLRKNLGEYAACIVTLRGVGYRFDGGVSP